MVCVSFGFLELVGQAGRSRTPGFVEALPHLQD